MRTTSQQAGQQVLMMQVYNETLLEPFSHRTDVIHWAHDYLKPACYL